jgi:tRNA(fMet)-specific endonuclease VapC
VERLILDSGALIALERGTHEDVELFQADADVVISAITASELLVGIELADPKRRERRRAIFDGLLQRLEVIAFDLDIARHHAALIAHCRKAGRPRGAHDLQIAATARATDRTVVTTDGSGFADLPAVNVRVVT